jgi:DNA-directed RNA polymerase specialized sigma24 family protein
MIADARCGNREARERFAKLYEPLVKGYLAKRWRLPISHGRVLDASQEVFYQCYKADGILSNSRATYRQRFHTYLRGAVRRVAANMDRQRIVNRDRIKGLPQNLDDAEQQTEASLSRVFDIAWTRIVISEAGLIAQEQADGNSSRTLGLRALRLRHADGYGCREIASHLGVDQEGVYEILRVAKKDFRIAMLTVMSTYYPNMTETELQSECSKLASST